MHNIGCGLWFDEDAKRRFRCESEGCGQSATYWDHMNDEMPLCRGHALWIKGKRERWGIRDKEEPAELKVGSKYCYQCRKTYDGNYISHKPNCYKR